MQIPLKTPVETPLETSFKIPFAKVACNGNELAYIQEVLESGWLTTASKAGSFEKHFAETIGAAYALAVNSCTSALHLALEACGVGPGDQVIVPALTFTASAETVRYLGADPLVAEVDYATGLLKPETVKLLAKQNPRVKAVMPVHYGGQSAKMFTDAEGQGFLDVCRDLGLTLIEDAAHAFPSRYENGGAYVGSLSETVACFSFYANKCITTGEGGLLATGSEAIYRRAKIMRLHGIDRDVWSRFTSDKPSWEYDVVAPGFKYNLPDILAAVGLAQLERAENMRRERERCAEFYFKALSGLPLDLPALRPGLTLADHSWHLFPIIVRPEAPLNRNRLIEELSARGIGSSVHYRPLYRMSYYAEEYGLKAENFPETERIWSGTMSLPIYPSLSEGELDYIASSLAGLLK